MKNKNKKTNNKNENNKNKNNQNKNNKNKNNKNEKHDESRKQKVIKDILEEIEKLNKEIKKQCPKPGVNPFSSTNNENKSSNSGFNKSFSNLPISQRTKNALSKNQFIEMTEIQGNSIPHARIIF
jgi:hypothetical protein